LAQKEPALFPTLGESQHPQVLWIGCSDSRVPETTLLDLQPGEVFVHRNIANILHPGDLSFQAVVQFAVEQIKVKHVVLCGHTCCGGVNAALSNGKLGLIDSWLLPLRALRQKHSKTLSALPPAERTTRLVELNVEQGVETLRQNANIIDAMRERGLQVHGLVYNVGTGLLRVLDCAEDESLAEERVQAFATGVAPAAQPAPKKDEEKVISNGGPVGDLPERPANEDLSHSRYQLSSEEPAKETAVSV
jgi:carbonic anhydrase